MKLISKSFLLLFALFFSGGLSITSGEFEVVKTDIGKVISVGSVA